VRRGEVWTVASDKGYAGKTRPVVIIEDNAFDATDSITVCGLTTNPTEAPLARVAIAPSEGNSLKVSCRLMVDKITTVPKSKLDRHLGRLAGEDILRMNRAIVVFLGLAG
jgi:mRNA interferase MazF